MVQPKSVSQSCPVLTCEQMNLPTDKITEYFPIHADEKARCSSSLSATGYGVTDAGYTWHHLMPLPPFNVLCYLMVSKGLSCPWGVHEMSSASYLRVRNII